MRQSKKTMSTLVALAAVAVLAAAPALAAAPEFIPLGVTCGPAFFPTFCAVDMSGDGSVVLTRFGTWTEAGGLTPFDGPPAGWEVIALSNDGSTVVGNVRMTDQPLGSRNEAAVYLGDGNWMPLGGLPNTSPCGSSYTSAYDVSGDGSTVVGLAWVGERCRGGAHGFRWTEAGGMEDLGSLVEGRSSRVNAISADASAMVGWSDYSFGSRAGAIWDANGLRWFTPDGGPGDLFAGEATGVNSDGSFVVGGNMSSKTNFNYAFQPWMWSEQTGLISLGQVKGLRGDAFDGQHYARDVSDDGSVVVGQDTLFQLGEQWAWLWTANDGIAMVQNYLRDNNPALQDVLCDGNRGPLFPACNGWDLWNMAAVSDDGSIMVGTGRNPDGMWEAFMVKLH